MFGVELSRARQQVAGYAVPVVGLFGRGVAFRLRLVGRSLRAVRPVPVLRPDAVNLA